MTIDSTDFNISPVLANELSTLRELSIKTFTDTFAAHNSTEHMKDYIATRFAPEQLAKELENTNSSFFFARMMGQLVGYLKINWGSAQTENQQNNSLEIERIYVLDKFHGNQFGQKLLEVALHMSKEKAVDYVWLGVWEHNSKAIHFYQKNGFVFNGTHEFLLGTDKQQDQIMRLDL